MKMIKAEFQHSIIENGSSYVVYITKDHEEAMAIHRFAMTQQEMLKGGSPDWYFTVSTIKVEKACYIPEFFHDRGYYATTIEHNNGDWKAAPKYDLYIVE